MKNKKKCISVLLLLSLFVGFIGCNSQENNSPQGGIFVRDEDSKIELYDEVALSLENGIDGKDVVWSSSDESVLVVSDGVLQGKALGSATVKAVCDGVEQSQKITVEDMGTKPIIQTYDLPLIVGISYPIENVLTFKGNELKDVRFSYVSSDSTIASVNGNVITANAAGSVTVRVTASLKDKMVAEGAFTVNVNANEGIIPARSSYDLYLSNNVKGVPFENSVQTAGVVWLDGKELENAEIVWTIGDSEIATLDENGLLTAKKVGSTTLVGEYSNNGKMLKTLEIPVNIHIPVLETKEDVILDKGLTYQPLDGVKIFGEETNIGKVVTAEGKEYTLSGGKLATSLFRVGEYDCTIYNESATKGVAVNFVAADYVIYDNEDFYELNNPVHASDYIVLANDIDYGGAEYKSSYPDYTFSGTFNGLGHVISNMTTSNQGHRGLFYYVKGATFKNFAMKGIDVKNHNAAPLFYQNSKETTVIDNVYIQVNFDTNKHEFCGGLGAFLWNGKIVISNSIVVVSGLENNADNYQNNGLLLGRSNGQVQIENAYAIGYGKLCGQKSNPTNNYYETVNKMVNVSFPTLEAFTVEKEKFNSKINISGFNHYWNKY